ncbi:MAG: DUF2442 domain-containing protein [Spirochaetaceae bacterium]
MHIPIITKVIPKKNLILTVEFSNGITKEYDCNNIIIRNESHNRLRDQNYFKTVKIDKGGHGLSWDDNIDLSEYEILNNSIN